MSALSRVPEARKLYTKNESERNVMCMLREV